MEQIYITNTEILDLFKCHICGRVGVIMLVCRAEPEKARASKIFVPCSLHKGGMLQNFHLG